MVYPGTKAILVKASFLLGDFRYPSSGDTTGRRVDPPYLTRLGINEVSQTERWERQGALIICTDSDQVVAPSREQ